MIRFRAALHGMTVLEVTGCACCCLAVKTTREAALNRKAEDFSDLIKIGRSAPAGCYTSDLGQRFSGYVSMLDHNAEQIKPVQHCVFAVELAIGEDGG